MTSCAHPISDGLGVISYIYINALIYSHGATKGRNLGLRVTPYTPRQPSDFGLTNLAKSAGSAPVHGETHQMGTPPQLTPGFHQKQAGEGLPESCRDIQDLTVQF